MSSSAECVQKRDNILWHVRFLYCLVATAFVFQVLSVSYLYSYIFQVNFEEVDSNLRSKRETLSAPGENIVNDLDKLNLVSKKLNDKGKNTTKLIKQDEDGMVIIGHSTRIPMVAIEGFCRATKEYCSPGPPGTPGTQGPVGPKGDSGQKGERGEKGSIGEAGHRGHPGDKGPQGPPGLRGPPGTAGLPGLDGRNGVPGEPGLDGVPGRNGLDGMPGTNGLPGRNGTDGIPGANGYNGTKGEPGSPGPMGPQGPRGIAGPRGRAGKPGLPGNHGIPGVRAWEYTINGNKSKDLLIPPSIVGRDKSTSAPFPVREGDNIRLRCAATGQPAPIVQWRRLDSPIIGIGSWKDSSLVGHILNFTRIRREQMGTYMCVADNGVPPPANQTLILEVKFEPMITVDSQNKRAAVGHNVSFQCEVEAFPEAVKYWKKDNSQLIETDNKYSMSLIEDGKINYKSTMVLHINNIQETDFGQYQCVAKNEIGKTVGRFQLGESMTWPLSFDVETGPPTIFGPPPPDPVDLGDLCPPPEVCPACPDAKQYSQSCKSGLYSVHELLGFRKLEVRPLVVENATGLVKRDLNCLVYAVGKPVYHRFTDATFGSWMRDPGPNQMDFNENTIWTTNETDPHHLYEFTNKTLFRQNVSARKYDLVHPFMGSAHVVFNGSFFYNEANTTNVVRFELTSRNFKKVSLPYAAIENKTALYSEQHNYLDFAVDDNGLWVIHGLKGSNNTVVVKLDAITLQITSVWNISVVHKKAGEMFIVCGVLYVVNSNTEKNTNIRFALDLYTNKPVEVDIPFSNPFGKTTMIGYNYKKKELYTWDRGNQLTYPIRYHDQGLVNLTILEEKGNGDARLHNTTGFEIDP